MRKQSTALTLEETHAKVAQLSHTRDIIKGIKERYAEELAPLEQVESLLKVELINGMNRLNLKSIVAQSGESYGLTTNYEFEWKADAKGLKELQFARENNLVRPDRVAVKRSLRALFERDALPTGVEAFQRQTISVRSAKGEEPENSVPKP